MRSIRFTKYNITFSAEDIVHALKVAYPHEMDVLLLPDEPSKYGSHFSAKLTGVCGLDITFHPLSKTTAQIADQNTKQRGEEFDPA